MIPTEHFEQAKIDLIETYKEQLCVPSLDAIEKASSIEELISIVNTYGVLQHYKQIPNTEWVRKWFGAYADELKEYGVYLDCYGSLVDPPVKNIILYGESSMSLIANKPCIYNVIMHDSAKLSICASGVSVVKVRQLSESKANIINKDRTAKIKIQ